MIMLAVLCNKKNHDKTIHAAVGHSSCYEAVKMLYIAPTVIKKGTQSNELRSMQVGKQLLVPMTYLICCNHSHFTIVAIREGWRQTSFF